MGGTSSFRLKSQQNVSTLPHQCYTNPRKRLHLWNYVVAVLQSTDTVVIQFAVAVVIHLVVTLAIQLAVVFIIIVAVTVVIHFCWCYNTESANIFSLVQYFPHLWRSALSLASDPPHLPPVQGRHGTTCLDYGTQSILKAIFHKSLTHTGMMELLNCMTATASPMHIL